MLTGSDIKKALRAAGIEVYRTSRGVVHVADRVRDNLIMDAGIRIDAERGVVAFYVRTRQNDFPGDEGEALHNRARVLAEPAAGRGFTEARTLVSDVTDVSSPEDGNRKFRKEMDMHHLAAATPTAQSIKLADVIDNVTSIVENDPGFARKYLREKEELLPHLRNGSPFLHKMATELVETSKKTLDMT